MKVQAARELLDDVESQLGQIDQIYAQARTTESITSIARPKVKSCLEHLRSALEYVAAAMSATLPPLPKGHPRIKNPKTYFPYATSAKHYAASLYAQLPGLDAKYVKLVDSVQPHVCGDPWLIHLAKATNFNKHVNLQVQERKNLDPKTLSLGDLITIGGKGSIGKLTVGGVLVNPHGPLTVETETSALNVPLTLPVRREFGDVKFILRGQGVDVLELLKRSHAEISKLLDRLEAT